jgi:hypothetical protein
MGLGITVDRNPVEFSRGLLTLEHNLETYRKAIKAFRRNLIWEEVARKHVILYNLLVNKPESPLLKINMFN